MFSHTVAIQGRRIINPGCQLNQLCNQGDNSGVIKTATTEAIAKSEAL